MLIEALKKERVEKKTKGMLNRRRDNSLVHGYDSTQGVYSPQGEHYGSAGLHMAQKDGKSSHLGI